MLNENDLEIEINNAFNSKENLRPKVESMFAMQDALNTLIDPDWTSHQHWDFQRATMVELVELMDHYGYKWWKKQEPNLEQCKLEIIDIAHFHISYLIQKSIREGNQYDFYVDDFLSKLTPIQYEINPEVVRSVIDEAVYFASVKEFSTEVLALLMNVFEITPEVLCNHYIVKNTLNIFRAKNGYKSGSYIKTWNGKEDNEVLLEVYSTTNQSSSTLADDLYSKLEEAYKEVA